MFVLQAYEQDVGPCGPEISLCIQASSNAVTIPLMRCHKLDTLGMDIGSRSLQHRLSKASPSYLMMCPLVNVRVEVQWRILALVIFPRWWYRRRRPHHPRGRVLVSNAKVCDVA